MALFVNDQKVHLTAMSSLMNDMAARIDKLEKPAPSSVNVPVVGSEAVSVANVDKNNVSVPTWSKVVSKNVKKATKKPRVIPVCGVMEGEYKGPKRDRQLKLVVASSVKLDDVRTAIESASAVGQKQVEIELVCKNPLSYSCTYRARIRQVRIDKLKQLLSPESWPSGMKVSEWRGIWKPLARFDDIKIFVGNLCTDMAHDRVEQNIQSLYEQAGFSITDISSKKFIGNRHSTDSRKGCLNLIVTLKASSKGVSMEPIWNAMVAGKIPAKLYIRQWIDRDEDRTARWI